MEVDQVAVTTYKSQAMNHRFQNSIKIYISTLTGDNQYTGAENNEDLDYHKFLKIYVDQHYPKETNVYDQGVFRAGILTEYVDQLSTDRVGPP